MVVEIHLIPNVFFGDDDDPIRLTGRDRENKSRTEREGKVGGRGSSFFECVD